MIKDAFKYIGKKEIHVNDLARYIHDFVSEYNGADIDDLKSKISNRLSSDVNKGDKSVFVRVKNGKKGFKRGVYSLRKEKVDPKPIKPDDLFGNGREKEPKEDNTKNQIPANVSATSIKVFDGLSTTQIGKGGEFAVVSELLLRGFNANVMTVDDGVDIFASKEKEGKFFLIQVKTTSCDVDSFQVNIDKSSYARYNVSNMYYIIVVRYIKESLPQNQYLIFNSFDIEKFVSIGVAGNSEKYYSMKFKVWNGDIRVVRQGKDESVFFHLNNWGWIK